MHKSISPLIGLNVLLTKLYNIISIGTSILLLLNNKKICSANL